MTALSFSRIRARAYRKFIQPRSLDLDSKRRELILNTLLSGLSVIAIIHMAISAGNHLLTAGPHNNQSLAATIIFASITLLLFWLSRRGKHRAVAIVSIVFLELVATQMAITWSFALTAVQLTYVLAIVMAGVLLSARAALVVVGCTSLAVATIGYLQISGAIQAQTYWYNQLPAYTDAVAYIAVLGIIGLVTWLANGEIDRSLARARRSEASLKHERDNLEITVAERTRELKEAQLIRVMELQRFAELGKMGASLLHDMANPLTVASLNIGQLKVKHQSDAVKQASRSLQHIERYVDAARKQLKNQGVVSVFNPTAELKQVLSLLKQRATKQHITLQVDSAPSCKLRGDAVKFNQLVANLIINAIEAYDDALPGSKRVVAITITPTKNGLTLTVQDWGKGISAREETQIFDAFFSTKAKQNSHMGIGLAMVKQYVEQDFNGNIAVASAPDTGTCFALTLKNHRA